MKGYKRSELQQQIIDGLNIVYQRLIESKRRSNQDIVVLKNNKIVHIKP